jgi:hypothetical protein
LAVEGSPFDDEGETEIMNIDIGAARELVLRFYDVLTKPSTKPVRSVPPCRSGALDGLW